MNILILEDEFPAYLKIIAILGEQLGNDFNHAHARSVKEGISLLHPTNTFDLIFSDIKLLDGTSFEIFDQVATPLPTIFCTAYDEHLLKAFKTNGIEYILKPFSPEDIQKALQKYNSLFGHQLRDKKLWENLKEMVQEQRKSYKKRFAIKKHQGIFLIETEEISYIEAFGELSKLMDTEGNTHISSTNIGKLHLELDPDQFFRINRSQIINVQHLYKMEAYPKNRLALFMKGQKSTLITSSSTTKAFRKWLER
ncbi:MAG: LytTR family DNA-binding domain-containing protein [Bacteroidota bacterium]